VLAHWDDVEAQHARHGHLGARWRRLGNAAGTRAVGVNRVEIDPGRWSTPVHRQTAAEEIFYVLAGAGLSWQDDQTYEVRPGDCIVHLARAEAHSLRAGPDGLDVLVFGNRVATEVGQLPRAEVGWIGGTWAEVGRGDHPWSREVACGEPELPAAPGARPSTIVNVDDVETFWTDNPPGFGGAWRDLGAAAGSVATGLKHQWVDPGSLNCPHHCHSAEEEVFVVLDGDGTLELLPAPTGRHEPDEVPVRAGHVVARPAGSRLAHAFRAGPSGLTLLAYGTRDPRDVSYLVRSGKLYFRGSGVITRVEPVDYWDGEA
jgi:uncharacterized cupin superfamily protein